MRLKLYFKSFILFTLLFHFQNQTIAQDEYTTVTRDLETWSKIGFKLKSYEHLTFGLNQQFRLNENSSSMDQIITDLNAKYKYDNSAYFSLGLRYIADKSNDSGYDNDFRFNFDIGYDGKIDRLKLGFRLRYQNKNEIGYSKSEGDSHAKVFRLKIGGDYNIKDWKFDPQFSAELFTDLTESSDRLQKLRFTLGTDYKFNKKSKIGAFYRIERELNESYPKTTYIIGVNYRYTLKTIK